MAPIGTLVTAHRGRAEVLKLALASKSVEFEVADVDYNQMKTDLKTYRFGQCPRYADSEVDLCQSNAILRHIGRKYNLYGASLAEAALVDEAVDGVEDLRRKYGDLIYGKSLADDAKAEYIALHVSPSSAAGARNGGAHLSYLANCLAVNASGSGWTVGMDVTIADIAIAELIDLHERIMKEKLQESWPQLLAVKEKVYALPGVKAYLESPLRLEQVNNNKLG